MATGSQKRSAELKEITFLKDPQFKGSLNDVIQEIVGFCDKVKGTSLLAALQGIALEFPKTEEFKKLDKSTQYEYNVALLVCTQHVNNLCKVTLKVNDNAGMNGGEYDLKEYSLLDGKIRTALMIIEQFKIESWHDFVVAQINSFGYGIEGATIDNLPEKIKILEGIVAEDARALEAMTKGFRIKSNVGG